MALSVEEVADGVAHVVGPRVAWQIVVDGDDVCLVDTGWPGDRELLAASLARVGRRLADVSAVLLTHAHPDHLGSAEHLRVHHGCAVHAHRDEVAHARGERIEQVGAGALLPRLWRPSVLGFLVNTVRHGALRAERVGEVGGFEADGSLEVPGRPVPVPTPGHTSGHCAYHLPDRGVLLSGDALVTEDPVSGRRGPRLLPGFFHHDPARVLTSLQRLRSVEAGVVLPGHGAPFRGAPAHAVTRALQA